MFAFLSNQFGWFTINLQWATRSKKQARVQEQTERSCSDARQSKAHDGLEDYAYLLRCQLGLRDVPHQPVEAMRTHLVA